MSDETTYKVMRIPVSETMWNQFHKLKFNKGLVTNRNTLKYLLEVGEKES